MTTRTDPRESTGEPLLASSARLSFDPATEVDWSRPLDPDKPCMPWDLVSLYGTPLWATMSRQQQLDLSRHEVASLAGAGIWLETVLMRMLLRHVQGMDPLRAHVRYAFTEIADECRHSMMFARLIATLDCPSYRPGLTAQRMSSLLASTANGVEVFASALIGEEILDHNQRRAMHDEEVQPLLRAVDRIHVVEEARHIGFARDELSRQWDAMSTPRRALARVTMAQGVAVVTGAFLHPAVYDAVGLDRREALAQVAASAHRRRTLTRAARALTDRFEAMGLIGGSSRRTWVRAGLLAA